MKRTYPACFRLVLFSLGALLLTHPSAGAAPRDELLRLVPQDVTFGLLVQDVRELTKPLQAKLGNEPLPPPAFWQDFQFPPQVQALLKEQEKLLHELKLGVTPREFLTEVVGDAVVFAYRKGTPAKPDQEAGMLLTWARDPKVLAQLLDRINDYQKNKTKELLDVKQEEFQGQTYFRRVRPGGGEDDQFYILRGNLFCFCTSETLLREAFTLEAAAKKVPPLSKHLEKLAVEKSFLTWWLNPRSFDAELKAQEEKAQGAERAILGHLRRYWEATEGIAFFVSGDDARAEMGLSLHVRKNDLPRSAQRFLAEAARPSALWQVIPEDALFAVAGRFEGPALTEVVEGFLNEQSRQVIRSAVSAGLAMLYVRRNDLPSLTTGLGPDWGFWVFSSAATAAQKAWFPQMLLAVRVRKGEDGPSAERALIDLVESAARIVCQASNGQIVPEKE